MTSRIVADAYVAPGATVLGDVRMASESSVFPGAVLNGVAAPIEILAQANVQDNCIVEGTADHGPEQLRQVVADVTEQVTRHCGGTAEVVAFPA